MSITKSIVDLMGGTIRVETEPGMGSEFIISLTLPLQSEEDIKAAEEIKAVKESETFDFTGTRVLLVDDNAINREIAVLILEESGFEVETAENGKQALDKVAESQPGHFKVVLMDIQMPVMNGYEATKAIRALDNKALAEIPVIAMTANAFAEDVKAAHEAGMNAHIAKPIDIGAMMATLTEILQK